MKIGYYPDDRSIYWHSLVTNSFPTPSSSMDLILCPRHRHRDQQTKNRHLTTSDGAINYDHRRDKNRTLKYRKSPTSPAKRDDASASASSWANIDTDKKRRTLKSRKSPKSPGISGDASVSMSISSWANIDTDNTNTNYAISRLCASDSAINYDHKHRPHITTPKPRRATLAPTHPLKAAKPKPVSEDRRKSSWGNMDVLFTLNGIEEARERAAKELQNQKTTTALHTSQKHLVIKRTLHHGQEHLVKRKGEGRKTGIKSEQRKGLPPLNGGRLNASQALPPTRRYKAFF